MAEFRLGYDLRFPFAEFVPAQWPAARRARFLLRPKIAEPASVDGLVWPSRFLFAGSFVARHPDGLPRVPANFESTLHGAFGLWPDTDTMWKRLRGASPRDEAVPVMITLVCSGDLPRGTGWTALISPEAAARTADAGWRHLGYDVADESLLSGLANCGYDRREAAQLRRTWAPRLNRHGLFDRHDDANAFRASCDDRVPEHKPFWVYRLFRAMD